MNDSHAKTCAKDLLARGPCVRIERCAACDVVTLHLGAVSLRLDRDAFASVLRTMSEAQECLPRTATTHDVARVLS
jgi:hypothetical protein